MQVTAVIPTYNEEKYIGKCIISLLNQSYDVGEIIIVDDGSSDKTRDVLKEYMHPIKRIMLLEKNHTGNPGEARNAGAKEATGDILLFVDADMEFDKDYVKTLIEPILKEEAIGTSHRFEYVANKDNFWSKLWGTERVQETEETKQGGIFRAIKREDFLKVGGFDIGDGYFDDSTLSKKVGLALKTNAICYHNNPSTFGEFVRHSWWIFSSILKRKEPVGKKIKRLLRKCRFQI